VKAVSGKQDNTAVTDNMPRIDTDLKLDFKDVLFRPKRSTIRSRADVSMTFTDDHAAVTTAGLGPVWCMTTSGRGWTTSSVQSNFGTRATCRISLYYLGMTKYRVDCILLAYRSRNGTALLCATRLIIEK